MNVNGKEVRVVGMIRSKNSARYLDRLFTQLSMVCDKILITDNESTDDTPEVCAMHPKVVRFPVVGFNGGRDWRLMWRAAESFNPDWVIGIDSDELFEDGSEMRLLDLMAHSEPETEAWSFPFFCCWDSEDKYNVSGWYRDVRVLRVFRYSKTKLPKDIIRHSTSCPEGVENVGYCDDIRMKHFGYMSKEDRLEKYNHYRERDKDMVDSGSANYEHFGPNANAILKDWSDWSPPFKVQYGSAPLRPGGYLLKDINDQLGVNRVDYIYGKKWLEIIDRGLGMACLAKAFSYLVPGGKMELIVPCHRDLFLKFIKSDNPEDRQNILDRIYEFSVSDYDYEWLKKEMEKIGFTNVFRKGKYEITIMAEKPV